MSTSKRSTPTTSERLREKNARIREQHQAGDPPSRRAPAVRTDPVRITIDLDPALHAALLAWCTSAAADLGRPRVAHSVAVRAVVAELLADDALAQRIVNRIAEDQ